MKKLLCAVMVIVLAVSGAAFAHGHEERYVREEAARRNMKLITQEEATKIATAQLSAKDVRFKKVELEDEDDYYTQKGDFKPVWTFEAIADGQEYDIDVDAVTGKVLKCQLDD